MARRGGGCLTAVAVVLSLVVFALGASLLYLVATDGVGAPKAPVTQTGRLEPKTFSQYSWDELAEVARLIAAAPTDEEGRAIAAEYGVSVGDARALPLDDGSQATLTVAGIRADERSDGSGTAGLTLMTSPISVQPMNQTDTNEGGWEASSLRAWLASEGLELLPDELAASVTSVTKRTNNVGVTSDAASVTETADALWLFSASEVCGPITWFTDEYGTEPNAYTGYADFVPYDALLSAEGEQYELFAAAGVSPTSDPSGALELEYAGGPVAWWYRTAYPYSFTGTDASYFFQVMSSGYPSTTAPASATAGVVAGLCL